ncbi:hypothetical protein MtrunA17_Chr1g0191321 [Medicago truncatula]|uniref:Uncharacterized protein n=1 Tax=Medicago truncatula TaxID=3880 RepID=G7I7G2_MEDTR|nr:hypothetical protein MTR_1g082260 [Medicago truncatula]RHN80721.1 hypothetical protein MtrunA17_Chr1g0191321 [Medicago truncatula]
MGAPPVGTLFFKWSSTLHTSQTEKNKKFAYSLMDSVGRLLDNENWIKKLVISILKVTFGPYKVTSIVSSVLSRNVNCLQLQNDDLKIFDTRVTFPSWIPTSHSLTKLVLRLGFLLVVRDDILLPSLKKLQLSFVRLANEKPAQNLFNGCPVLEETTIYKCCWRFINNMWIGISNMLIRAHYYVI